MHVIAPWEDFPECLEVVLSDVFQSGNKICWRANQSALIQIHQTQFCFCFVFLCSPAGTFDPEGVTLYFKNAIIKYTLFQSRRNDKLLHWTERYDVIEIWRRKYTWSDCKEWWYPIINNSLSLHGLCSTHVGVGHHLVDKLGTTSIFVDGWRWFVCLCLNPQFESQVTNTIVNKKNKTMFLQSDVELCSCWHCSV